MPGQRKPLAASSTARVAAIWSLTSMRRVKPPGNVRCLAILRCLQHDVDSMQFVRPATQGASVVRWCACAPRRGPLHTRQWVGTYAGKGNGDYRGELASALRAIIAYLKHFAFPPEMALIRLDGAGCAMRPSSLNCFWPAHLAFRDGEAICSWSIRERTARAGSCTDGEHGEDEQRCGRRVV